MSKPERQGPAACADRAGNNIAVAANAPEYTPDLSDLQHFRAAWLMRRLRLAPAVAEAIAPFVFGREARG